ncbi:MAG TPA: hypothetical protein VF021_09830 [Longimicrobiales bacterium]
MRRRKVFRTAAAYLAGSFVLLQVADLTFEPLGVSADAYRLLVILCGAGFPLAILASWFFDLRADRATDAFEAHPDRRLHRWTSLVAGVFVLVCAGAIAWFSAFRYRHADYGDAVTLAVLPFDVIGGSDVAYLRTGMVEMISRNVDGAANVRAIAPEMVIAASKSAKSDDAVARRFSVRYLVSGNIATAGNQLRITASIHDYSRPSSKPLIRVITTTPQQLLDAVDRLSAQILASTRTGEDAHLSESAALTTSSLPALRAYLEGEDHYRAAQYDSAIGHFTEAVSLDSTFALAYSQLASAQLGRGRMDLAREPLSRAMQFSTRLSQRDMQLVHAFGNAFDGHWRESEADLRSLQARYPEDLAITSSLGTLLSMANPQHGKSIEEPKALLEKVTSIDTKFLCPI